MLIGAERVRANRVMRGIQIAIRQAEKTVMAERGLGHLLPSQCGFFPTEGKRGAVYEATRPYQLQAHFDELTLPAAAHYSSWGAGLGMDSFQASFNVRQVTSYEIDPGLCRRAEAIRREHGIENVRFINRDFLDLTKAELSEFNIVFLFWPFKQNFNELAGAQLLKLKPDTVVITHSCFDYNLFPPSQFQLLWPQFYSRNELMVLRDFFTVKRLSG